MRTSRQWQLIVCFWYANSQGYRVSAHKHIFIGIFGRWFQLFLFSTIPGDEYHNILISIVSGVWTFCFRGQHIYMRIYLHSCRFVSIFSGGYVQPFMNIRSHHLGRPRFRIFQNWHSICMYALTYELMSVHATPNVHNICLQYIHLYYIYLSIVA